MNSFWLSASGLTLEIQHRYKAAYRFCEGYRVDAALPEGGGTNAEPAVHADAVISVTEDEIAAEQRRAEADGQNFSAGYCEITAIFRKIAEFLPRTGRFLMHGSAVALDGEAYIFTAPSGTGKSTHTSFWRSEFGERAVMVNDDKPFIRIDGGKAFVSGNPWNVLSRGAENTVRPLDPAEAFPTLLRQVYRPADPQMLAATLDMLDALEHGVKLYGMECNLDPGAARVAYENMR